MNRNFMSILKLLAREDERSAGDMFVEDSLPEDALIEDNLEEEEEESVLLVDEIVLDIFELTRDLIALEDMHLIGDEELDMLKAFLAYVISIDGQIDQDDIYTMVFGRGKRILWN